MATEHEPEQEQPGLDEVLEAEAEALAAELEQAEQEGMEPGVLEEIEGTVETAAEALITVRDARHKLQEVRKAQPGHWAGDQQCSKAGAGLARPKPSGKGAASSAKASPQRRVRLAEATRCKPRWRVIKDWLAHLTVPAIASCVASAGWIAT